MAFATVVSVFPFETIETKPGLARGYFVIPAAKEKDFEIFVVDDSFYTLRLPATEISVKVPVLAEDIARSIVEDFINSHIAADGDGRPGMFWLPGKLDKDIIASEHKMKLAQARVSQKKWFENLVRLADNDWNQFHNTGLITDHQRYAAKALGYKPEWLIDYNPINGMVDCKYCYTKIDARASVCPSCRSVLNESKAPVAQVEK